jgi:hypothetical protein
LTAGDFENWRLVNEALVLNHEGFWKHNILRLFLEDQVVMNTDLIAVKLRVT